MSRLPTGELSSRSSAWVAVLAVAITIGACGGQDAFDYSQSSEALTGSDAVARGQLWVNAMVPYCQSPNGEPDPDHACSNVCMRPMNTMWDPYRSDCSGFVSWAWGLPAPGRTTSQFAPAVTDITEVIDGNALEPGDALNIPSDHIILFVSWITPGQSANFMEEPGCSSTIMYAHAFTSDVQINGSSVFVSYEGMTFTAIRYLGLTGQGDGGVVTGSDAGTPCYVSSLGQSGECMLTSDCASAGGTSTPGYCPGPADIQCCTMAAPPGCNSNTECPATSPVCDTTSRMCRGCQSNSECRHGVCAKAANDPLAGQCVECTANADCPSPSVCDTSTDTCVQCLTDAQCPATAPVCTHEICQTCRSDADCSGNPHGKVCQTTGTGAGACVECASDSDCHAAAPTCDAVSHRCECQPTDASCHPMSVDAGMNMGTTPGSGGDQKPVSGGCATGPSDLALFGMWCAFVVRRRQSIGLSRPSRPGTR